MIRVVVTKNRPPIAPWQSKLLPVGCVPVWQGKVDKDADMSCHIHSYHIRSTSRKIALLLRHRFHDSRPFSYPTLGLDASRPIWENAQIQGSF